MSAWSVAYYVYCLSGLGFLVVLILSVHRLMWLAYVGQTALAMMYAATLDGEFQRWFGLSQALSGPLTLLTGASLATYSYCLVAKLIQPGSNVDQWRPVLYAAALLSALAPFGLFYFDLDAVHRLLLVLLAGAFIAQALPPLTWGFLPRPLRPRAMPIIQLIILLAAVGTAVFSTYIELSEQQWLVARRMALACVVTAGVITMMYMTYIIERTRAASARRALAAAEREAATSRALLDAERAYSRARKLAADRTVQLSSVSHDLRQPLDSLRMMLGGLVRERSDAVALQAGQALDYLDELAKSFLETPSVAEGDCSSTLETVPVGVLFSSLEQMFRGEAENRDVSIRIVPTELEVRAAPVPLMRILANLLANALKHARCTRVLLGARRRGNRVILEVIDDGRGLDDAQSCGQSAGTGLGLNIIRMLSEQHGFEFSSRSEEVGAGCRFSLSVQRASAH